MPKYTPRFASPNKTGYRGVKMHANKHYFQAHLQVNNVKILIGNYATAERAAKAYDEAAREWWGDFAVTNRVELRKFNDSRRSFFLNLETVNEEK